MIRSEQEIRNKIAVIEKQLQSRRIPLRDREILAGRVGMLRWVLFETVEER